MEKGERERNGKGHQYHLSEESYFCVGGDGKFVCVTWVRERQLENSFGSTRNVVLGDKGDSKIVQDDILHLVQSDTLHIVQGDTLHNVRESR